MEELEKLITKYEETRQKQENVHKELKELAQDDSVKRYIELQNSQSELIKESGKLYKEIKTQEFSSCKHIWIATSIERDSYEGKSYRHYGCIKCGLSEDIKNRYAWTYKGKPYIGLSTIQLEQKAICDFLDKYPTVIFSGTHLNLKCDLNLARAIYFKVKASHPNIDDKTLISYLNHALKNINDIKVNPERLESRAKRLSLSPEFSKWKATTLKY